MYKMVKAVSMSNPRVFYSWQSVSPNNTNRGFIQRALEQTLASLRADPMIELEPVIDRATDGIVGAPDIAKTIFTKIEESAAFVCDISFINPSSENNERLTPNPNVLIELGYALRALGEQRIIMVFNAASGPLEQLPFDIRGRPILTYRAVEGEPDRSPERNKLAQNLHGALLAILKAGQPIQELPDLQEPTPYIVAQGYSDSDASSFGQNELTKHLGEHHAWFPNNGPSVQPARSWVSIIIEPVQSLRLNLSQYDNWKGKFFSSPDPYNRFLIPSLAFPKSKSLIFYDVHPADQTLWNSYLSIDQQGRLEYVASDITIFMEFHLKKVRTFRYVQLIGTVWRLLFLFNKMLSPLNYKSLARVTINMVGTEHTRLIDYAPGWPDALDESRWLLHAVQTNDQRGPICAEPNLQFTDIVNMNNLTIESSISFIQEFVRFIARAYNHHGQMRCFTHNTETFSWEHYVNEQQRHLRPG
jgi:hypothetical protein